MSNNKNFKVKNGLEVSGSITATGYNNSNWDTAYGWGNHASAGYLTSETNDLSVSVTWANVPDANITQSSVTQHQAALSITESQISDLQSYLTSYTETNDLTASVTWANVPDANITQSSVTQHQAALSITESQISDLQSYLTGNQTITLSGDVSGSGTTSISVTVANDSHTHDTQYYTETEIGNFFAGSTAITGYSKSNWDTAYSWGDHSTQSYATTTYVDTAVSNLVDSAPAALDTLNELAAALGDDANFSTTVTNSIGTKWTQDNTKISNWDTAYGWGNHASAGYLPSSSYTASNHIRILSGGTEANLDSYTDNGIRTIAYTGYGKHLLSWNAGSSPGTIQQEFHYNPPANGWRIRGKTDNTTWGDWGYVVTASSNQGRLGGTVWHSGNDGSGSGLDADLLDGIDSSQFLRSDTHDLMNGQLSGGFGAVTTSGTTNWNDSTNARSGNGYTLLLGTDTNGPGTSNYFHPFSFEYSQYQGAGNMTQFAIPYTGNRGPYFRSRYSGSWASWAEIWNSGNDGSGSGLDADLLDGQQGSYYAPLSSLNSYLPLSGGTLTSTLSINTSNFFPLDITGTNSTYTAIAIRNTGTGHAGIYFDASNGDLSGSDYVFLGQRNNLDFDITMDSLSGNMNLQAGSDITIKPAAGNDILLFNQHNSESQLRLYNDRQDLGNVPVSSIVAYNSSQVSKIQFYRGGGGASGYIKFQVKPTNEASLTDTFQIGDSSTVGYGVDLLSGSYRVGGTTVIDSSRNLTNIPIIYGSAGNTALELNHATYTMLANPEGARCLYLGDSGDRGNYYDNDTHYFRTAASAVIATINSSLTDLQNNLKIRGTQGFNATGETASIYLGDNNSEIRATYNGGTKFFLNGTDRMEIEGGTGNLNLKTGNFEINGTTVIDSNRNLINIPTLTVTGGTSVEDAIRTVNGRMQLGHHSSGSGIWYDSSDTSQYWFVGLSGTDFRFYRGGNKFTLTNAGNGTFVGSVTASQIVSTGNTYLAYPSSTRHYYSGVDSLGAYMEMRDDDTNRAKIRFQTRVNNTGSYTTLNIDADNSRFNFENGSIDIASTTVIDTSRNLTNIGTITSKGTTYVTAPSTSDDAHLQRWRYTDGNDYMLDLHQRVTSNVVRWSFGQYNNGSTYPDMLVFKQGLLGFGTQDPTKQLHIYTTGNEGIYLEGTAGGVWMDVKSASSELWSMGADGDGWGIYNRTQARYHLTVGNNGTNIRYGALQMGGTTVIDSNRNLTNISGIYLPSANSRIYFGSGNYRAIEGSSDGSLLQIGEGYTTILTQGINNVQRDVRSAGQVRATGWWNDGTSTDYSGLATEIGVSGGVGHLLVYNRDSSSYGAFKLYATTIDLHTTTASAVNLLSGVAVNSTTVIDSNRNLTNIGTIGASNFLTESTGYLSVGHTGGQTSYMSGTSGVSVYHASYPAYGLQNASYRWLAYMPNSDRYRIWSQTGNDVIDFHPTLIEAYKPISSAYANNLMKVKSTGDSQTIGLKVSYLDNDNLAGYFRYTTGDAQLYIDNAYASNGGETYSNINFRNGSSLTTRMQIKGNTGRVNIVNGMEIDGKEMISSVGGYAAREDGRITMPAGAHYVTSSSSIAGAIKITIPKYRSNTMLRFTVKVYIYDGDSAGYSFTLDVGGYNYGTGGWYNVFANIIGNTTRDLRYNVRFGDDGSNSCVWIGDVGGSWAYPQVFVTDVQAGYSGYDNASLIKNWNIGFATSLGSVYYTIQANQVGKQCLSTFYANNVSCGYDSGVANSVNCSDWFRSSGNTGWYNATYSGGIYMTDSTWVRVYNSKAFYVSNSIAATGDITAYYSDMRLKTKISNIDSPIDKVKKLDGFIYVENDLAKSFGYNKDTTQAGLSAQQVQEILPEAVSLAPFDYETKEDGTIVSKSGEDYLTVDYSRVVPLLVEAIKEQQTQIERLEKLVQKLMEK